MNKLFVVGYMVVDGYSDFVDSNLAIKDNYDNAKALLGEYLNDFKEEKYEGDNETLDEVNTFFFMVEQELNGCLTHFDMNGGTRGEIVLSGAHTMLFKFDEWEPTLGDVNDAIEKLKNL